ncbi:MAG TPA: methionyl-tRNA formyltransferase, partial [Candidatus Binataceae bacterium]|nr:methionyl-tRNA formyltransferase [Candidatus Binataceae bacterium]
RIAGAVDPRFAVVAVVTQPDEPRGLGLTLTPSEVAAVASRHGLPIIKPRKIRTPEFLAELKAFAPDLLVVAAYGRILPDPVLAAPRLMPINVHASLLPRHRGAAPIEGAILAGDTVTGVTIMRITSQMDAGPMLLRREIPIAREDTQGSLKMKLAELGGDALLETLDAFARGTITETTQDETRATFTRPVRKEESTIDWNREATVIERMIRAYDPWPVARTTVDGSPLMLWRGEVLEVRHDAASGTVLAADAGIDVVCGQATVLRLLEVQASGRRRMRASDFARGRPMKAGEARLGA